MDWTRVHFWGDRQTIEDLVVEIRTTPPEQRAAWRQEIGPCLG